MAKPAKWILPAILVIAMILAIVQSANTFAGEIETILTVKAVEGGSVLAATGDEQNYTVSLLRADGSTEIKMSLPRRKKDVIYQIADIGIDSTGLVYILRDSAEALSGKYTGQDLLVYNPKAFPLNRTKLYQIGADEQQRSFRYRWLSVSASLVLTGVSSAQDQLMRLSYDLEQMQANGQAVIRNSRVFLTNPAHGVFYAAPSGSDTVYISKSGKVFLSGDDRGEPRELFPGQDQSRLLSYATFAEPSAGGFLVGEQESGDILWLTLDSSATTVRNGADSMVHSRDYRTQDILMMSMLDERNYAAVVQNPSSDAYEIVVVSDGNSFLISHLRGNLLERAGSAVLRCVLYFAGISLLVFLLLGLIQAIRNSRTVLFKLASFTIPLLVLALVMFGTYSYSSYKENIDHGFEKQVQDEGNLMAALLGSDVFNAISYPRDYNNKDYQYIQHQMGTRAIHVSSAYYEGPGQQQSRQANKLFTGVDSEYPCFYSLGIVGSKQVTQMYRRAALTGQAQMGRVTDRYGSRIACVTPVGGTSGSTVFLLETSMYTANLDQYTRPFIQRYLLISGVFLLSVATLLILAFIRILGPLGRIIGGLEQFATGNRKVRLPCDTNDELADICRVFNKMAGDIDAQIFTLNTLSDTYYRFIPQRIFQLLGKDNLGELELGSSVEGKYHVMSVNLHMRHAKADFKQIQELTNAFFNIVHTVSNEHDAILIHDSINLRSLKLICKSGDAAILIAMTAIAHIDSHNATSAMQNRLDVSFLLDMSQIYFSICGDENRYIPAMIAEDLEWITRQSEVLRQLSSRLIVTSEAYGQLAASNYLHRFIGFVEGVNGNMVGLYDFYDSSIPSVIRLLNATRDAFEKAMDLYQQQRYYDAKNLFTVVLRENQYDNIARHYIFQCEKKI